MRYEVFRRLGRFVTESSEHFAEYVPWFIKEGRGDLLDEFGIPLDEYPRRCVNQIAGWEELRERLEDPDAELTVRRSEEYGAASSTPPSLVSRASSTETFRTTGSSTICPRAARSRCRASSIARASTRSGSVPLSRISQR